MLHRLILGWGLLAAVILAAYYLFGLDLTELDRSRAALTLLIVTVYMELRDVIENHKH